MDLEKKLSGLPRFMDRETGDEVAYIDGDVALDPKTGAPIGTWTEGVLHLDDGRRLAGESVWPS